MLFLFSKLSIHSQFSYTNYIVDQESTQRFGQNAYPLNVAEGHEMSGVVQARRFVTRDITVCLVLAGKVCQKVSSWNTSLSQCAYCV